MGTTTVTDVLGLSIAVGGLEAGINRGEPFLQRRVVEHLDPHAECGETPAPPGRANRAGRRPATPCPSG